MGRRSRETPAAGTVYLVGAGPGDPGLLTVRGQQLLRDADAVVHDALVSAELLKEAASGNASLYDVGKRGGDKVGSSRQEHINELLIQLAREGKRVVRLKGGDPFVFGRGGEEAQALAEAGLEFEIVPGVTSGIAAPAYAGIPVTHRGLATAVTFVTGHEDPGKGELQVNWEALARSNSTIVLYMGVRTLRRTCDALVEGGASPDTPAAAIEWGTYPRQRTVVGTVSTLPDVVSAAGIDAPVITVIGWTVVLRDEIAWFDRKPLFGKRILVTRAGDGGSGRGLGSLLMDLGAGVLELPATRLVALDDRELRDRLERLEEYDWLAFTSANAVKVFWDVLRSMHLDARALGGTKACAVGPATAAALLSRGVAVDVLAMKYAAQGLLDSLAARDDVAGRRFLFPCAAGASDALNDGLTAMGADVDRVHTYSSEPNEAAAALLADDAVVTSIDMATFTSASGARSYAAAVSEAARARIPVASIGPTTSAALREAGIEVAVESPEASLVELARCVARHFEEQE